MKNYSLEEQLESVQRQVDKFEIEEITKNEKMILIKARIHCPIYFAFYSHFIVCSGDYGEWVFDCTWNTVNNNHPILTDNLYYLLGKLSHDCNEYLFDYDKAYYDIDCWLESFYEGFDEEDIDDDKKAMIEQAVDILKSSIEENRVTTYVDDFRDTMEHLGFDMSDDYELYDIGKIYNTQLVVNLACIKKLVEMNEADEI